MDYVLLSIRKYLNKIVSHSDVCEMAEVIVKMCSVGRNEHKYELGKHIRVFRRGVEMKRVVNHGEYKEALDANEVDEIPCSIRNMFVHYIYKSVQVRKGNERKRSGKYEKLSIKELEVRVCI